MKYVLSGHVLQGKFGNLLFCNWIWKQFWLKIIQLYSYIIKLKIQCWPVTVHGGLHWLATPPHPPLDQPIQASIAYVDLFYYLCNYVYNMQIIISLANIFLSYISNVLLNIIMLSCCTCKYGTKHPYVHALVVIVSLKRNKYF